MSKILQSNEILNSFTGELEKKALNLAKVLSKINPFLKAGKKVAKTKPNRLLHATKELSTIPIVGGAVLGIGGAYGALTLPPEI